MKKIPLFISIFTLLFSTAEAASLEVYDLKRLTDLPSASGHFIENGTLYAVGDDSPSVYALDADFNISDETNIANGKANKDGRIPGEKKADLEACDLLIIDDSPLLVMLGSGTQSDTREKALLFSPQSKTIQWKNIKPFYRHLRKVAGLNKNEFINIEGFASTDESVFLLNRGSHGPNLIFSINKAEFISYLSGKTEQIKSISSQSVKLPSINKVQATLSGATYHLATQSLIITASVDAHDDGGILGSFITSLPIAELAQNNPIDLSSRSLLIKYQGEPLKSKVESVALSGETSTQITGVLAADNDDGSSQFMRFKLNKTQKKGRGLP